MRISDWSSDVCSSDLRVMTMTKLLRCAAIAAGGLLLATGALAEPPPGLDARVEAAMQAYGTPGFAISIVTDGDVVHAKGYGARKPGSPGQADAGTTIPHRPTHPDEHLEGPEWGSN